MEAFFDCNAFGEEDGSGYLGEIIYKYNKQNQLIAIKQNGEYERNEQEYFYQTRGTDGECQRCYCLAEEKDPGKWWRCGERDSESCDDKGWTSLLCR